MRNIANFRGTAAVAVLCAASMASGADSVHLSYSFVEPSATVNEPVYLRVILENGLDDDVTVDLGIDFHSRFHATLSRPDGRTDTVPERNRPVLLAGVPGRIHLEAHGRAERRLLLNRWFSFDVPGRYFLDLELTGIPKTGSGIAAPLESRADLVMDVCSRDPDRLSASCARIERQALSASDVGVGLEAADALGFTADPVAVPYIDRLMGEKPILESRLINGLQRIADSTAVDVLISRLNSPSEDSRDLARFALNVILIQTRDPQLSNRIKGALQ